MRDAAAGHASASSAGGRVLRVLDLINTDRSARELLVNRVTQVTQTGRYRNAIYCSGGDYVHRMRAAGHEVHVVDTPRGLSPLAVARAILRTYRLLRRERFDIIHTHGSVIGLIGRVAAWLARTPIVAHQVHGFHHHDAMRPGQRAIYIWVEKVLALLADRLVFQNQADVDECLRRGIAPRRKLALVGNGIQFGAFAPGPEPANDPPIILCVARFEPVKNHGLLLEAARLLAEQGVAFRLLLVGDGELRGQYEGWVREHGLAERVEFLGYRDDVPALTAAAEVCVLPSLKEGLPRAIIEAAACARPMVATNVVGNRDTIIDGVTGFLVPLDDAAAMAGRLAMLLADAGLRRRIGQAALAHARQHFDERAVTERIIALYDELAGAKLSVRRGRPHDDAMADCRSRRAGIADSRQAASPAGREPPGDGACESDEQVARVESTS